VIPVPVLIAVFDLTNQDISDRPRPGVTPAAIKMHTRCGSADL